MCAAASVIMPRSFLIKKQNYSHCPLKKRPVVQIYKEVAEVKDEPEDNSEPENLSTKPEDLIRTSSTVHQYYKSLTPPLGVTPISNASKTTPVDGTSVVHSPILTPTHPRPPTPPMPAVVSSPTAISSSSSPPSSLPYPYQHHTGAFTPIHYPKPVGGPLEPLNLNTAHAEHLHYWPRGGAASLPPYPPPPPPTYLPFGYHTAAPYHHHHHHHHHATATPSYLTPPGHDQLSPYAPPRESAPSPPSPLPPPPPPVQTSTRPTYVPAAHPLVASLPHQPRLYMPYLTSSSTSPDLPEYYSRSSPIHSLPINPLPPPTPEEDGDENARPSVVEFVSHGHPAPPSPPLSSSTVEDLSSPSTPPGDSAPTSVSPSPVATKKSKTTTSSSTRHQCSDCSKSYSTFSGLSKHRQFHCKGANGGSTSTGSKKSKAQVGANGEPVATFSCKHCDKTYVSLGALKMHIRTHTLPCECKLCGKAFSRPWLLQGHIRTHTGEKPFSCQHCCRAFADRSNLRAHLQTHSDVKKYSCPRCARTFSRMSLLAKHADGGCVGNVSSNNNNISVNNNSKSSAMQISSQVSGNDGKIKSEEMRMEVSQVPMAGDYYHVAVKSEVSY